MEVIFRNLRMVASDDDDDAAGELVIHHAHLEAEAMIGPAGEDGMAELEGFWLRVTETGENGEPQENAPRIRFPIPPETMRLFASGMLDYLDKARGAESRVHVSGVGELHELNRASRRAKVRRS